MEREPEKEGFRAFRVVSRLENPLKVVPLIHSNLTPVKFYPGDYGTMTKNDQIPFVYYGIDDDVNKPCYYN